MKGGIDRVPLKGISINVEVDVDVDKPFWLFEGGFKVSSGTLKWHRSIMVLTLIALKERALQNLLHHRGTEREREQLA